MIMRSEPKTDLWVTSLNISFQELTLPTSHKLTISLLAVDDRKYDLLLINPCK